MLIIINIDTKMFTLSQNEFCFCTLALGAKYELMTQELAQDLQKYAPQTCLVVGSEHPENFKDFENIIPFYHTQQGILHCYNDKRFIFSRSLQEFTTAIYIDADTRITTEMPATLQVNPGITGYYRNLREHLTLYRPENLNTFETLAKKLDIPFEQANWIGEALFMVTKDEGKEQEFLKLWGLMANYLQLKGIHSGEGCSMGLAAAKMGWQVQKNDSLEAINATRTHLDASKFTRQLTPWQQFPKRLTYHYRLNKTRLMALKDFDFYYR